MELAFAFWLLLCANGAPILAQKYLGRRWCHRVDCGVRFVDGQPLLGDAKTWRGIGFALILCAISTVIAGLPLWLGVKFGLYAMLGDLFSSFIKRRLGIPPSGQAIGLDQIPEALLPLWLLQKPLGIEAVDVVLLTCGFLVVELSLSRLLYRWHIRNRPY